MRKRQGQSHVKWYCRYHVVFTPTYRKKGIFGSLKEGTGKILRELCEQEKIKLLQGRAMADRVHLCLSIPPKYSMANTLTGGPFEGPSSYHPLCGW